MTHDARSVFAGLPKHAGWDFGGLPYGLEPLTLPEPGSPDLVLAVDGEDAAADGFAQTCQRIQLARDRKAAVAGAERCGSAEELFWFRWITGHQVCFVIWRLMAQVVDDITSARRALAPAFALLCQYVQGYSAMLLYTGSCPRDLYHSVIRPSMRLRHPSFSGRWAPDYEPVRNLFRPHELPFAWSPESEDLARAIRFHQCVHDGVAARLVPDGRSLLRQSPARVRDIRLLSVIYDSYFMTLRAPVTRHDVVAQLLRRLLAIAQDLAVNALHPEGIVDLDEPSAELIAPEAVSCENRIGEIIWQVASGACNLGDAQPGRLVAPSPT